MGQAASMCRFRGCRYKKNKSNKNTATTTTTTTANSATTAATAATTPTNTANSSPVSGEQNYRAPRGLLCATFVIKQLMKCN